MFVLAYVPAEEQKGGEAWKVDRKVTTDMKGNLLSAAEVENRKREKLRQQGRLRRASTLGAVQDRPVSQPLDPGFGSPASIQSEPFAITSTNTSNSTCCHKRHIRDQQPMTLFDNETAVPAQTGPLCYCGPSCSCPFCPVHHSNQISQQWLPPSLDFGATTGQHPELVDHSYSNIQRPLEYTTIQRPVEYATIQRPVEYNIIQRPFEYNNIQRPFEYTTPSVAPAPLADTTMQYPPRPVEALDVAPPPISDTTMQYPPGPVEPLDVAPPPIADTTTDDPFESLNIFDFDVGFNFENLHY